MVQLLPGDVLLGYCKGYFGRNEMGPFRVEACGADWVVARLIDGPSRPLLADGRNVHKDLAAFCKRFGAIEQDGEIIHARIDE